MIEPNAVVVGVCAERAQDWAMPCGPRGALHKWLRSRAGGRDTGEGLTARDAGSTSVMSDTSRPRAAKYHKQLFLKEFIIIIIRRYQ